MGRKASNLKIAKNLSLPAEDLLESVIGVIGKRGRGKTGKVKVMMEELVRVNLPFIALDPVGVMWGIRSSIDGKGPGLPVLIVGGSHGDVRLDRRAGAEIAKAVVQSNISCIIDFSEESKTAYREFVKDFAHTLFSINDTPRMVIIEEAPELVPQRMRPDMTGVFEAVERLVSRGRNKGIGVTLVSQRAATINKDVLTQIDALFVFGLTSPQDRKALAEWVQAKDDEGHLKEFEMGIASLQKQEAWFWSPEAFGGAFKKVKIRDFNTFHPDKTHLRRTGQLQLKPVTTDISKIVSKLGDQMDKLTKEKIDVASIPKLQSKIKVLERKLEHAKEQKLSPIEIKKAIEEAKAPLLQEIAALKAEAKKYNSYFKKTAQAIDTIIHNNPFIKGSEKPQMTKANPYHVRTSGNITTIESNSKAIERDPSDNEKPLRAGEMRILKHLASRSPLTLTKNQLGTLSGFTPSGGTFSAYYGNLKRRKLITIDHAKNISVTEHGMDVAGEIPPAPSTPEETLAMWKSNLRAGEARILQEIVDAYPESISKDELGARVEMTYTGGTFNAYIGILKRNSLIFTEDGRLKASEMLCE